MNKLILEFFILILFSLMLIKIFIKPIFKIYFDIGICIVLGLLVILCIIGFISTL